jgi:hypothetical protein
VKIRRLTVNQRKAQLEIGVSSGRIYPFPFSRLDPRPTPKNRIRAAFIDRELGNEGVTYVLESGAEGSLHIDHVLEYNEDPRLLSELLTHRLTLEARERIDRARLSRREIVRRMRTSLPQLYRLLDPANTRKSLNQLVALLHVLGCDVDVTVRRRQNAA